MERQTDTQIDILVTITVELSHMSYMQEEARNPWQRWQTHSGFNRNIPFKAMTGK